MTAAFLHNFGGDNVRFLARNFGVPGDHYGQQSSGYRWPYGPVAIIAPFNFPLEIPVLQLMGALFMGNKPVLKPAEKVNITFVYIFLILFSFRFSLFHLSPTKCHWKILKKKKN